MTVAVQARFDVMRGDPGVIRPVVGAHERDAKSITRALDGDLEVFVGIHRTGRGDPYVSPALAFDTSGRVAWLGECASGASNAMAARFEQAGVDPKRVGPALKRWISDGDTDALLHAFAQK